jgi:hypothetical protein
MSISVAFGDNSKPLPNVLVCALRGRKDKLAALLSPAMFLFCTLIFIYNSILIDSLPIFIAG